MSKRKVSAVLLACSLFTFAAGCKKKAVVAPPPVAVIIPPAAREEPKPSISSFTAEPSTIEKGQAATLRWSVSNATDISIDNGLGAVRSDGSRQVFPSTTTAYTLTATGPGGTVTRVASVNVSMPPAPPPAIVETHKLSSGEILASDVQDAYFDYDKSDVRADAQTVLTKDSDVLKKIFNNDAVFKVVVEGHCDERGSAEYNLGLGDQRANKARDFLVQLGVPADHLKIISYGKDKPQCTDATEDCYQRNRRAHFSPGQ